MDFVGVPLILWIRSPSSKPIVAAMESEGTSRTWIPPSSLLTPKAENCSPNKGMTRAPIHGTGVGSSWEVCWSRMGVGKVGVLARAFRVGFMTPNSSMGKFLKPWDRNGEPSPRR